MSRAPGRPGWVACLASLGIALALISGACSPAPSVEPSGVPSGGSIGPSFGPDALADALAEAVDPAAITADLGRLAAITTEHGGTRQAGSAAYDAAATFVADELRRAGYHVMLEPIQVPVFAQLAEGALEIQAPGAPVFDGPHDFRPMLLSPSGDVTARLYALGFDRAAKAGDRNGVGCDASAWEAVPAGSVVLVQPGHCYMRTIVEHAQAAGAAALISANPDWTRGRVLRPTLLDPAGLTIPVLGVAREVGLALADAADAAAAVHLVTSTSVTMVTSASVIADTAGDPAHVVMLGAHLDSVIDGPGINDNGSGAMTVLEIARRLAALTGAHPAWTVRVAFWTGEEIGLRGSVGYVESLRGAQRDAIAAYLNFDMLASPNGIRAVYDGSTATNGSSVAIDSLFGQAFDDRGLAWQRIPLPSSDEFRFDQVRIPVGGIFSGATGFKTEAEAATFGGTAGAPADACYHLACDAVDNVDAGLLEDMARAAAWVVGRLAAGEVSLPSGG